MNEEGQYGCRAVIFGLLMSIPFWALVIVALKIVATSG